MLYAKSREKLVRTPSEQRRERATNEFKLEILPQLADFEVTQHVFEKLVEEKTIDPLFVTHCPKELAPLAKQNAADNSLVDVFELIINDVEIAPGYSELNDPVAQVSVCSNRQAKRSKRSTRNFCSRSSTECRLRADLVSALIGLTMLLIGAESMRDVILFPLLRPKK